MAYTYGVWVFTLVCGGMRVYIVVCECCRLLCGQCVCVVCYLFVTIVCSRLRCGVWVCMVWVLSIGGCVMSKPDVETCMRESHRLVEEVFALVDTVDRRLTDLYNDLVETEAATADDIACAEDYGDALAQARIEVLQRLWTWNAKYKEVV